MPFLKSARGAISQLPKDAPLRLAIEYLLKNAIGRKNPCPLAEIVQYLNRKGIGISETGFQQTILKATCEGEIFIASSNRGYFLIADEQDAIVMRDFYSRRISAEQAHLKNLKHLASKNGWRNV